MSSTENITVEPFQINYNIYYNCCCCCCFYKTQQTTNTVNDINVDTPNNNTTTTPKVFQKFFTVDTTQNSTIVNNSNVNKTYRKFNAKKYLNDRQTQVKNT
jgi:hypothetical protein